MNKKIIYLALSITLILIAIYGLSLQPTCYYSALYNDTQCRAFPIWYQAHL